MFKDLHRSYSELLKRPEWKEFCSDYMASLSERVCQKCSTEERLEVHHKGYRKGVLPWEYRFDEVALLCRGCHEEIHAFADELWNEALKLENQWEIHETRKAVSRIITRRTTNDSEVTRAFVQAITRARRVPEHEPGI